MNERKTFFTKLWDKIKSSANYQPIINKPQRRRKSKKPKINPNKSGHPLRRFHFGTFSPVN